LYAQGNSCSDIRHHLQTIYGLDYSTGAISEVTEQVSAEITQWQQRDLLPFYAVLFLDGVYFNTRDGGKSSKRVSYSVYGVDADGNRDVLGIYLRDSEGAHEWGRILEDLQRRGLEDVLYVCVDGLSGFSDAISEVFPKAIVQRCIVHMVRNSVRFVSDKDRKAVCMDLRKIYTSSDVTQAEIALEAFKLRWDKKYKEIAISWKKDWDDLVPFLDYGENIRRMIYTTNSVEALHRQIRKVTKTKGSWVNDKALIKQIYLTLFYGKGGWNRQVFNWNAISKELLEAFGSRFEKHFKT
jgi:transposase-like protein